ncbi:MAG: endonuclease domain-containing protein [bacterium]|nr:endonuclease domain-containing protein [bacterium]
MLPYHPQLKVIARTLRKNMTKEELRLWRALRKKEMGGFQFYRQKPLGQYVVDFYCPAKKLVIEIDGSQHYEDKGIEKDEQRNKYLEGLGLKVLRFTNLDVLKNLEGVVEEILR